MKLYVDLDLGRVVARPGLGTPAPMPKFKRGDGGLLSVQFCRGTSLAQLDETTPSVVKFALKAVGVYDTDPVVALASFTVPAVANGPYLGYPNLNTTELDALLAKDLDSTNDLPEVDVNLELTWSEDAGVTWLSTETLVARVENDVIRGDEGTPTSQATPDAEWVAHGHAQTLTAAQKTQAWDNIGFGIVAATDNDAKLALTGLADGQQVEITGEGKRLERYTGDTAGLYTSIDIVGNATTAGVHGYGVFHWEPTYGNFLSVDRSSPGSTFHNVTHDGTKWQLWLGTALHSYAPNSAATVNPADVVGAWTFVGDWGGTGTVDEVNAIPIATERNWHTLKNTVYLTAYDNAGSGPYEFNGVTVGASATVAVGWVPVSELILVKGAADWYIDAVNSDTSFQFGTKTTVTHVIVIGTNVILADDFPSGALVTIASD